MEGVTLTLVEGRGNRGPASDSAEEEQAQAEGAARERTPPAANGGGPS